MKIRKAVPTDAVEICALHKASIREVCSQAYPEAQIRIWVEPLEPDSYLSAMERFEFYVAEQDGILGFSMLNVEGAELNAIYVHPDAIGRGVGRKLLDFSERLAKRMSVRSLKLKATLNAVGFYEACGFKRGDMSTHRTRRGLELPCVEMTKDL
ncbi:sortase-like acyltransferase [Thioflavicoccus mobilis 8321]|uniref:Sortase-like acyltransferase n=1 Tax=Thioflavicoccus mobilis 8321 TaxID=765912 RepID=L0GWA4_9GAMM|nr:GNAT family N-acetyltransferase [Thioflavicoccus mobilis]AGA89655.1 sortase-like acyltransferase [Thioflavicoccus mobilis 8321]